MLEARACDVGAIFILILYCRTQDDLAIMIEGSDGQYYLQAGAVLLAGPSLPSDFFLVDVGMQCTAGTWRLEDKVGLPLDAIHTDGHVPHCTRRSSFLPYPYPPHTRAHS